MRQWFFSAACFLYPLAEKSRIFEAIIKVTINESLRGTNNAYFERTVSCSICYSPRNDWIMQECSFHPFQRRATRSRRVAVVWPLISPTYMTPGISSVSESDTRAQQAFGFPLHAVGWNRINKVHFRCSLRSGLLIFGSYILLVLFENALSKFRNNIYCSYITWTHMEGKAPVFNVLIHCVRMSFR